MLKLEKKFDISEGGSKAVYVLVYELKGRDPIEFNMSEIIARRSKDDGDEKDQYRLINSYLDYKGPQFQEDYYIRLEASYRYIKDVSDYAELIPLPLFIVHDVLDLFDLQDIYVFLRDKYKLRVPQNLKDVFDDNIESDGRGTRDQTYTKPDYLELAALSVVIKSVIGVIGQFARTKAGDLNTIHKEYILFNFFQTYPRIYDSDPMQKLIRLVRCLLVLPTNEKFTEERLVIEKQISREDIPAYIIATVVIQKIGVMALAGDNESKNIVTKIYNYVKNKLKSNGDVTKTIRDKSPSESAKDETQESESPVETYRSLTDIEQGKLIEFNWALRSVDVILQQLPKAMREVIKEKELINAADFVRCFRAEVPIHKLQIIFLGTIFKSVIDPRAMDRIDVESLLNLFTVGFSYLWNLGFRSLALQLTSKIVDVDSDEIMINSVVDKSRMSKELRDKLDEVYPCRRVINASKANNVVVEAIDLITAEMYSKRWIPTAFQEYVDVVRQETESNSLLSTELKVELAEFFIKHEEML